MPDPDLTDLLRRLDLALSGLAALQHELRAFLPAPAAEGNGLDDLADANLLDVCSASARFGYPPDTLRKWAREEGVGRKVGGRWLVSIEKLQARINGGRP